MFDKEQSYHEHTENTTCACKHTEPVSLTSMPHLSPDHFSSSDPASVMKTQRETANLLTFFLTYLLTFFLTYLLKFFLTYLLTFFLTYLLTFFLTYLLTCFLTYLLTFFLTYRRQNIASTASHKSHSTNSIFTSHHAAKVISMTALCLSNGNSTVAFACIGQPRQEVVESKDAKRLQQHTHTHHMHQTAPPKKQLSPRDAILAVVPQLHLMACANHEVRCLPLWFFHLFCVGGSARHIMWVHEISQNEAEVRKTAARFSSSCSPSSFGTALPSYATYHLFPSTTSCTINIKSPACVVLGGSMHT